MSAFSLPHLRVLSGQVGYSVDLDGSGRNDALDAAGAIEAFSLQPEASQARARLDSNTRRIDALFGERYSADPATSALLRDRLRRRDAAHDEKSRRRVDAIDGKRRDANVSATSGWFLARELEYIYPEVVQAPYPAMDSWTLFPTANVDPGRKTHTYRRVRHFGDARLYIGGNEIPVVNSARDEVSYPMHTLVTSLQYDLFESLASGDGAPDKLREDMAAADRVLHELGDHLHWHGDAANKFYGVVNTPGMPTRYSSTAFDGSASADDVLAALFAAANHARLASKGTMGPDSIVFSQRVYAYLSQTRLGSVNDTTILEFFLKQRPDITSVEQSWHLDGTGTGGRSGILFYRRDRMRGIQVTIGSGFTMLPVQELVFNRRVYFYMRLGGVVQREVDNQLLMWVTTADV